MSIQSFTSDLRSRNAFGFTCITFWDTTIKWCYYLVEISLIIVDTCLIFDDFLNKLWSDMKQQYVIFTPKAISESFTVKLIYKHYFDWLLWVYLTRTTNHKHCNRVCSWCVTSHQFWYDINLKTHRMNKKLFCYLTEKMNWYCDIFIKNECEKSMWGGLLVKSTTEL